MVFTIFFFICIFNPAPAPSQPSPPNNRLILGIRTIAPPITGFCYAFMDTLKVSSNQSITVDPVKILNQYKGSFYSRYIGLLRDRFARDHIDIECGPNSISSGQLINPNSNPKKPFSEEITFSQSFYTTGIKLLLKKELAQSLSRSASSNLQENLKRLKVGVIQDTSTSKQLEENTVLYQSVPIGSINPSNSKEGINSLERVLSALDKNGYLDNDLRIDALASDALILQSFLEIGVEGSGGSSQQGELIYIQNRPPYKKDYAVFPSKEFPSPDGNIYLPGLKLEDYAIATKKGTSDEAWLSGIISNSLNNLSVPGSKLKAAQDKLKPFETGQTGTGIDEEDKWWIHIPTPIAVAGVTALGAIIVALLNPQLLREMFSALSTRIKPVGSPSTSRKITVLVQDSTTNKRIGGASVSLTTSGIPLVKPTDSEGVTHFSFSSSDNTIMLRVEAKGYAIVEMNRDASQNIIDIRLQPVP